MKDYGKALAHKKAKGIDLTIIIGAPKGGAEEAPEPQVEVLGGDEPPPEMMAPPAPEEDFDHTASMSDYEKESLMTDKPRSLKERVQKAQLEKKMKGEAS